MKSIIALALFFLACFARGQSVPPLINYQGKLSNVDGSPLATADDRLTFDVFDSGTNSGGLVWGPQIFGG